MTAAGLSASRLTDRVSFQILGTRQRHNWRKPAPQSYGSSPAPWRRPLRGATDAPQITELPLGSSAIAFSHTLASGPATVFPGEIYQAPRSWAERASPKIIYFHEVDKGGHFAAWEEPELPPTRRTS
jgi:hypothetical protein